jgi:hypothetical protein
MTQFRATVEDEARLSRPTNPQTTKATAMAPENPKVT